MQEVAVRCQSKTLHGTVSWRAGTLQACSDYPGRVYKQSMQSVTLRYSLQDHKQLTDNSADSFSNLRASLLDFLYINSSTCFKDFMTEEIISQTIVHKEFALNALQIACKIIVCFPNGLQIQLKVLHWFNHQHLSFRFKVLIQTLNFAKKLSRIPLSNIITIIKKKFREKIIFLCLHNWAVWHYETIQRKIRLQRT